MYRRALRIPHYEGLLLRRTWDELKKHHFRLMEREAVEFRKYGFNVEFSPTNREMYFHDTGAVIEGGHMEQASDVDKYLGRERDDIAVDEGVTFDPHALLQLSTRARSTKQGVLDMGGARFRVYTNPGGAAASMLRDFFIDHTPNWEDYSEELKDEYRADNWAYIPGSLEDNPYLPPSYQSDLAVLQPWRFKQLRYNDWDVLAGTFFPEFMASAPYVQDLGDPGSDCEWFHSLDWGYIKPGCVLWWACMPDGILYIRYALKFSHITVDKLVEKVKEIDVELGIRPHISAHSRILRYSVADKALKGTNTSQSSDGMLTGETYQETFANCGMPIVLSNSDRVQGWGRVRDFIKMREDGRPTIVIHPDAGDTRYLIRTFAAAISDKHNPEDVDTTMDDHALDALRYGAMTRPAPTKRSNVTNQNTFNAVRARMLREQRLRNVR